MDRPKKLVSQEKVENLGEVTRQQSTESTTHEYGTVEEMLRHDAAQTPVPPVIGRRLEQSVAELAPPPRSWWRRLFGG